MKASNTIFGFTDGICKKSEKFAAAGSCRLIGRKGFWKPDKKYEAFRLAAFQTDRFEIIFVPKAAKRESVSSAGNQTRSDVIYPDDSEAPLYKIEGKPKYARPY